MASRMKENSLIYKLNFLTSLNYRKNRAKRTAPSPNSIEFNVVRFVTKFFTFVKTNEKTIH